MNASILARRNTRGSAKPSRQQRPAPRTSQPTPGTPRIRMPAVTPCATSTPRTVVVDDMVVAEDTDSESEVFVDSDGCDSDGEDKPKVIKVITRKTPSVSAGSPEPAWHALLRRTPNSRTASIACSVPRARGRTVATKPVGPPPPPPLPTQQQQHVPQHGQPRMINVPARVLVPRNRLVFPLATRGRTFTISRQIGRHGLAPMSPVAPKSALAVSGRLRQGGRGQAVSVLGPRVFVSATGPLSAPEKAVLDGVLDMQEEQDLREPREETISTETNMSPVANCTSNANSTANFSANNIAPFMEKYSVTAWDTFHDDIDIL